MAIRNYEVVFYEKEDKNIHEEMKKTYQENSVSNQFSEEIFYDFEDGIVVGQSNPKKCNRPILILGDERGKIKSNIETKLNCILNKTF